MQFNANIRISEQEISSLLEYFLQRAKVYWRFISTIRISEQKTHIVRSTGKRSVSNNRGLSAAKPPDKKTYIAQASVKTGTPPRQPLE